MSERLYTVKEIAEILGISANGAWNKLQKKGIKPVGKGKAAALLFSPEVIELVKNQEVEREETDFRNIFSARWWDYISSNDITYSSYLKMLISRFRDPTFQLILDCWSTHRECKKEKCKCYSLCLDLVKDGESIWQNQRKRISI